MDSFYDLEKLSRLSLSISSALLLIDTAEENCRHASYTSSSTKFLAEQRPKLHDGEVANTILHSLLSSNSFDSTGWFAALLSSKLIIAGLNSNISVPSIVKGYTLANSAVASAIDSSEETVAVKQTLHIRHISWEDLESVLCVINTSLSSRQILQLTPRQTRKVSVSLLTVFLSSLDRDNLNSSIVFKRALGLPVERIMVFEDTLVMDIPVPTTLTKPQYGQFHASSSSAKHVDLIVSIFENSLELSNFSSYSFEVVDAAILAERKEGFSIPSLKSLEYLFLEKLACILKRSKVTLVACQRRIHPYLVQILRRDGIICLPRLSIRYCGALQRLSGARQLVSFPLSHEMAPYIEASSLGYLASIGCRTLFGKKYVVASNVSNHAAAELHEKLHKGHQYAILSASFNTRCAEAINFRQSATSTLIITAPSELLCSELQLACEDIIKILITLLSSPYVLQGSGTWQMTLADELRHKFSRIRINMQRDNSCNHLSLGNPEDVLRAASMFVKCLHDCGRIISGNSEMPVEQYRPPRDSKSTNNHCVNQYSESSRSRDDDSRDTAGINKVIYSKIADNFLNANAEAEEQHLYEVTPTLEALVPNRCAVQLAVEAAMCVLDIDASLRSHPIETHKNY